MTTALEAFSIDIGNDEIHYTILRELERDPSFLVALAGRLAGRRYDRRDQILCVDAGG